MTDTSVSEAADVSALHDASSSAHEERSEDASLISIPEPSRAAKSTSARSALTVLAAQLPLQLDLRVPLPRFRVQNLLSLEKGHVIETAWPHTEDLPLWSGGVQLVWTEFEVVDQKLAVRITRLA